MKILDKVEELIEEADIHSFEKNNYRTNARYGKSR